MVGGVVGLYGGSEGFAVSSVKGKLGLIQCYAGDRKTKDCLNFHILRRHGEFVILNGDSAGNDFPLHKVIPATGGGSEGDGFACCRHGLVGGSCTAFYRADGDRIDLLKLCGEGVVAVGREGISGIGADLLAVLHPAHETVAAVGRRSEGDGCTLSVTAAAGHRASLCWAAHGGNGVGGLCSDRQGGGVADHADATGCHHTAVLVVTHICVGGHYFIAGGGCTGNTFPVAAAVGALLPLIGQRLAAAGLDSKGGTFTFGHSLVLRLGGDLGRLLVVDFAY